MHEKNGGSTCHVWSRSHFSNLYFQPLPSSSPRTAFSSSVQLKKRIFCHVTSVSAGKTRTSKLRWRVQNYAFFYWIFFFEWQVFNEISTCLTSCCDAGKVHHVSKKASWFLAKLLWWERARVSFHLYHQIWHHPEDPQRVITSVPNRCHVEWLSYTARLIISSSMYRSISANQRILKQTTFTATESCNNTTSSTTFDYGCATSLMKPFQLCSEKSFASEEEKDFDCSTTIHQTYGWSREGHIAEATSNGQYKRRLHPLSQISAQTRIEESSQK